MKTFLSEKVAKKNFCNRTIVVRHEYLCRIVGESRFNRFKYLWESDPRNSIKNNVDFYDCFNFLSTVKVEKKNNACDEQAEDGM